MKLFPKFLALTFLAAGMTSVAALDVTTQIVLELPGTADRRVVSYLCEGRDPFEVQYIDAAPNFLAIIPVEQEDVIFAGVAAETGGKYVSGPYEWLLDGQEAILRDIDTPDDAEALATCQEARETP